MSFYARENQLLSEHLTVVSVLSQLFAGKFGFGNIGSLVGLLHDQGKYTGAFQNYLQRSLNGEDVRRGEVIHALQGAKFVDESISDQLISDVLGNVISSHHSGLFDSISDGERTLSKKITKPEDKMHYEEAVGNFRPAIGLKPIEVEFLSFFKICQQHQLDAPFMLHLLTKVLFSCVVDADRCNSAGLDLKDDLPDWSWIGRFLEEYLSGFSADGELNQIRQKISQQCKESGGCSRGIYTLSIPTGGGKTLSSLRFALEHAKENKLERIIYVIPYLSILDQTADELRKVFRETTDDIVLEHHSNIELPEDEDEESDYRLLCSRWDSPIVLTTMVQFLETIYSNKASKLRKFHNMANSVIVFDEVQALPIRCTHLFNDAVNFLRQFGQSTILLCTATQPHLHEVDRPVRLSNKPELVQIPCDQADVFDRVSIEDKSTDVKTVEGIASLAESQITQGGSTLIILNSKKSAQRVFEQCTDFDCEKVFLTTDLCPAHRMALIDKLRENLKPETRQLSLCISTQLIEAGVDISFDCVIRSKAGLDSIIQAAGRCNRNKEHTDPQTVYVVDIEDEKLSRLPEIESGKSVTSRVFREKAGAGFLSKEAIDTFYKYYFYDRKKMMDFDTRDGTTSVYSLLSKNPLGAEAYKGRNDNREYSGIPCAFDRAAKEFSVIDAVQTGVVVPYGEALRLVSKFENTYEPNPAKPEPNFILMGTRPLAKSSP
jgi:CRISPR-associated endonuclease/helicase Cas3